MIGRQRNGVAGLHVVFTVRGKRKAAKPCGAGCCRARFAPARAPRAVHVTIAHRTKRPWLVALPATWPPRDARALVARTARTWRSLESLTFDERLASGVNIVVHSTWRVQARDRLANEVRGGWAGVVIGARRWDRAPGGTTWTSSTQIPASVTAAHFMHDVFRAFDSTAPIVPPD